METTLFHDLPGAGKTQVVTGGKPVRNHCETSMNHVRSLIHFLESRRVCVWMG